VWYTRSVRILWSLFGSIAAAVILSSTVAFGQGTTGGKLEDAQRLFYSGRYDAAAAVTLPLCTDGKALDACELRTSSLHFQIRRAIGDGTDRELAWKACAACPELMAAFMADTTHARALAHAALQQAPNDQTTLFLLGKIDLNYVWLQLGTLGKKTGWDEYREARSSIEKVLAQNPTHVRARIAHAWIEYIVGTRMPFGTRWVLGGGNKKRGLAEVRDVAVSNVGGFFEQAEADFALWDMQVREKDLSGAFETAQNLARDFPENRELTRFVEANRGARK